MTMASKERKNSGSALRLRPRKSARVQLWLVGLPLPQPKRDHVFCVSYVNNIGMRTRKGWNECQRAIRRRVFENVSQVVSFEYTQRGHYLVRDEAVRHRAAQSIAASWVDA